MTSQPAYYQYGRSAVACLYDQAGNLRIRALRPNTRGFVTDNTLWSALHLDEDNVTPLDEAQFNHLVADLGGSSSDVISSGDSERSGGEKPDLEHRLLTDPQWETLWRGEIDTPALFHHPHLAARQQGFESVVAQGFLSKLLASWYGSSPFEQELDLLAHRLEAQTRFHQAFLMRAVDAKFSHCFQSPRTWRASVDSMHRASGNYIVVHIVKPDEVHTVEIASSPRDIDDWMQTRRKLVAIGV
jgi:hypothetical protein